MTSNASLTALLWIVATGFFMQTVDTTIVNTALPAMAASLGVHAFDMKSVVVAYSLTMAMLTPASGWLADRFGTRRIYFAAILVFATGSVLCASSHSVWQLVAARVVQGIGGSMLLPVGRLAVLRTFPSEGYLAALAFVSIAGQAGPLLGPVLGGWLVQVASWHWIFLLNVPIGVAGCAAVWYFLPREPNAAAAPFDMPGFILLSICMVAFSLALDAPVRKNGNGAELLWNAGLLLLSILAALLYVLLARRRRHALFPLSIFKQAGFSLGLFGNLVARTGASAVPFLLPLLLQLQLGYSPLQSGMMMLPVALAGVSTKRAITPMVQRFGYTNFLVFNTAVVGLSIAGFATLSQAWPLALQIVQLAIFGAANSLQFTAMNGVTLKDLGREYSSSGNSLFSMVQMLAIGIGVTLGGALVQTFSARWSNPLLAFRLTFICVGLVTLLSALVFVRLGTVRRSMAASA